MSQATHIRQAGPGDIPIIAQFLQAMVEEMASLGGHSVAKDNGTWTQIRRTISEEFENQDHLCLLAEVAHTGTPIGLVEARVMTTAPVFEPMPVLHIHALYVMDTYRRAGTGQALLKAALTWGRDRGCTQVELNVLIKNPARALYEKMGFQALQVKMVRKL